MPPSSPWVIQAPKKTYVVGVADMIASNQANSELVTYSLGSCLGVVLYDPTRKVGGLLHLMLPDSNIDAAKAQSAPYMFVDTGVPRLFHAVYSLGGEKARLHVKVAGGAQFLDEKQIFNIGQRNVTALRSILARNGVSPHAEDIGGTTCRTVRLDLATGQLMVHSPGLAPYAL